MPDVSGFDLDYRPASYWSGPSRATANIKGTARRRMLAEARAKGESLPPEVLASSLPEAAREEVARIHPALMGGEFLPDYDEGEVTIARVELASVTGDVIDVRARALADSIAYRITDEYDTGWTCRPTTSALPLSMRELTALIDGASDDDSRIGLTSSMRDMQLEADVAPEELADFVAVHSDFYPQLSAWYEAEAKEWVSRQQR